LRRKYPVLRRSRFLTGEYNEELGVKDLAWINASGAEMRDEDWADGNQRCFGMLIDGRAQATGIRQRGVEATLLLVMNAHHDVVLFTLPECQGGSEWELLVDTNKPELEEGSTFRTGDAYETTGRSLLLYALRLDAVEEAKP
jgi:glycogen operon protein